MKAEGTHDPATLDFYAREAPVYTASGPKGTSSRLQGFMDRLTPGCRVLELGCGGGRDAEAMIAAGFEVNPTDGTPEIAAQAEVRLGRTVRVMRFDELDAVAEYDAVWANASLLHVPRDTLPAILGLIHTALKPGGLHFANFKGGGAAGRDAYGRYYNYLNATQACVIYEKSAPWHFVDLSEYKGKDFRGNDADWVAVTVRKGQETS